MQILSIKTKGDRSNPDECACVRECQRRGGTAWFSPFLAAQSLARHRRQRKESKGGGRERGAERGGAGSICKAGCESPQGEGRRGEERRRLRSGGRTGSVSVIDIPSCLEWMTKRALPSQEEERLQTGGGGGGGLWECGSSSWEVVSWRRRRRAWPGGDVPDMHAHTHSHKQRLRVLLLFSQCWSGLSSCVSLYFLPLLIWA